MSKILAIATAIFLPVSIFSQKTINASIVNNDEPVTEQVKVTVSCGGGQFIGNTSTGSLTVTINTCKAENNCECVYTLTSKNYHGKGTVSFRSSETSKNVVFKANKKINKKEDLANQVVSLRSRVEELEQRNIALEDQARYTVNPEKAAQLEEENKKLKEEIEVLRTTVQNYEEIIATSSQQDISLDDYLKLKKEFDDFREKKVLELEEKLKKVEEVYRRTLVRNSFKADCLCINSTDNSITLSIKVSTNEIKDEEEQVIIPKGQPIYQKVQLRIVVEEKKDERDVAKKVQTENYTDELIYENFFNEHPATITFRANHDAFSEGFMKNKKGYQVLVYNPSGTISGRLELEKVKERCKNRPWSPIVVIRP